MKYVKLNLSFGDKLKLLFFGIISEDNLPEKEVQVERIINNSPNVPVPPPPANLNNDNEEEEKFHIPFFSDTDDVKTNF